MKVKICEKCKTYNPADEWNCNNCGELLSVDTLVEVDDSHAAGIVKIKKTKTNKILHVSLSGGIIGLLTSNPRVELEKAVQKANAEGWYVVQVIDDATGNLIIWLLRIVILLITLLLYTTANGYYVVLEKERIEFGNK
jgi:RNA polymerase subunit RPABC4/transcription elongation factor Spt4